MEKAVVRFAPSPTGNLHIGGARTALFNYLFARKNGGPSSELGASKFILRIEDTDKERSKPEYEQNILDGLKWLGLEYDEIYYQSKRTAIYREYLEKLIENGGAYVSKEEVKEAGQRAEVIRLKNQGKKITFQDLIRGEVEMDTADLGDFVIAKDLETPIFHFTNVVDDLLMGITHIIRGEDHISNTPRQILIGEALAANGLAPVSELAYAHIPLILAPDRSKLSKRHGAVALTEYKEDGYLPAALINFLATLGWSPQAAGLEQEILSLEELIKYFQLEQVQKSGAIFNLEKLDWFNREYIKRLPEVELLAEIKKHFPNRDEKVLRRLLPEITSRIKNFADLNEQSGSGEWDYFFEAPELAKELLRDPAPLSQIIKLISDLGESEVDFTAEKIKTAIWDYATSEGRGKVLWPMRVALSGRAQSADPFTIAAIIGKEETIKRLTHALNF